MSQIIDLKTVKNLLDKYRRNDDSSKYDFGHVLVISGALGMIGASVLAAKVAMRTGAGLATCCVPEGLILPAMSHFVEEMAVAVPSDGKYYFDLKSFDFLIEFFKTKKISVVVLGPGLGRKNETIEFVKKLIGFLVASKMPAIIDADALYAISDKDNENFKISVFESSAYEKKNIILTPHEKEMQRLVNVDNIEFVKNNREHYCSELAEKNGIICVLKGKNSVVSDGENVFVNTTGNPGMATAGSGDVLAGILAGIKAQYNELTMIEAAKIGVFLHGLAGDIARNNVGENCLIASDIIKFLPEAYKSFL